MPDNSSTTETPLADGKIIKQVIDGVGVITFNNPDKRNAMSLEMWEGFGEALTSLRDDETVRVVILRGAGGRAFVSGADISQFEKTRHNAAASEEYARRSAAQRALLADYPKPTIACIEGFCLGGGMQVAMLADIRLAAHGSQFGIPAAKLGIAYGYDGLKHLVSLVGPSWARLLMYTGMRIDSAEALRIGPCRALVSDRRVVGGDDDDRADHLRERPARDQGGEDHHRAGVEGREPARPGGDQGDRPRLHGQRGFSRGPAGLHGKAQAAVYGQVASASGRAKPSSANALMQ
ncbi:enoyl-CoA hydratase/carnithine racemase [Bradyrhizobium japonicum]